MNKLTRARLPARQLRVAASADVARSVVAKAMLAAGFTERTPIDSTVAVFEYGGGANEALLAGFSFMPGAIGKHVFCVIDARDEAGGVTELTMSVTLNNGARFSSPFYPAYEATLAVLREQEILVALHPELSSYELPEAAPTNPRGFRTYWSKNANFFTF